LQADPAVPLAGKYRLIDIPISNCLHAGIDTIAILTQYNLVSLPRHFQETKPPTVPSNIPAPPPTNWTQRYKESGQPADYQLYDQIWVRNAHAGRVTGTWIHRREDVRDHGADHDPVWIW
jgi:ADP-glucose pyrophosphorylase